MHEHEFFYFLCVVLMNSKACEKEVMFFFVFYWCKPLQVEVVL